MSNKRSHEFQVYGIIGANIGYSLSPRLYDAIFQRHKVNAVYNLYDFERRCLTRFVENVRALKIGGFNVTTPYKQEIIPLLDQLDRSATRTSSVNLVLFHNSRLTGYNTDLDGIGHSIESQLRIDVSGGEAIIFGSGGSANSVYDYLDQHRARTISVVHRSKIGSKRFSEFLKSRTSRKKYKSILSNSRRVDLPEHQICVNCTPVPIQHLVSPASLTSIGAIFELRYGRFPLLSRKHIRGNQMLAVQAAKNLKLMEGLDVPYTECLNIIDRAIRGASRHD